MKPLIITGLNARAVMAPLTTPITTANAVIPKAPLVLIDLQTDQGIVGRSYLFTYTPIALRPLCALLDNLSEVLIGEAVNPAVRFTQLESTFRLLGRQGVVGMAIAGLDMALWDAHARAHDQSVAGMLGAAHTPVPCYESLGVFDPARDRSLVEAATDKGFGAIKIKIGASPKTDIGAIAGLYNISAGALRVMVDYNQSLSVPEAILRIKDLEKHFDLDWVEEPTLAEDLAGHHTIRQQVATPVQTGENWWMPEDAARAMHAKASDHAMLDIMKIGGITGWMRAAAMAQGASVPVSSHLFIEATSHVMAATPNRHLLEHLDLASALLRDPYDVTDGKLTPKGPGLGMEWIESNVEKYAA